ncbi:hypothetical protein B0H19DRAFT_1369998 [Mycena capillaripes]|nr:hypothetical protein B0H19DRAFT_1369998 [Mycena capillaripes]
MPSRPQAAISPSRHRPAGPAPAQGSPYSKPSPMYAPIGALRRASIVSVSANGIESNASASGIVNAAIGNENTNKNETSAAPLPPQQQQPPPPFYHNNKRSSSRAGVAPANPPSKANSALRSSPCARRRPTLGNVKGRGAHGAFLASWILRIMGTRIGRRKAQKWQQQLTHHHHANTLSAAHHLVGGSASPPTVMYFRPQNYPAKEHTAPKSPPPHPNKTQTSSLPTRARRCSPRCEERERERERCGGHERERERERHHPSPPHALPPSRAHPPPYSASHLPPPPLTLILPPSSSHLSFSLSLSDSSLSNPHAHKNAHPNASKETNPRRTRKPKRRKQT